MQRDRKHTLVNRRMLKQLYNFNNWAFVVAITEFNGSNTKLMQYDIGTGSRIELNARRLVNEVKRWHKAMVNRAGKLWSDVVTN